MNKKRTVWLAAYLPETCCTATRSEMHRVLVAAVLSSQAAALQLGFRAPVTAPRAAAYMQTQVESLLSANRVLVDELATIGPDTSELTRLRFALQFPDPAEAKDAMRENVAWRAGAGKSIVESAAKAVAEATAGGAWDNEPVRAAAPHAAAINEFVTPKNILTLSTDRGDLVYCIRASGIDDKDMMTKVTVDQVVEFFLYAKEVHNNPNPNPDPDPDPDPNSDPGPDPGPDQVYNHASAMLQRVRAAQSAG